MTPPATPLKPGSKVDVPVTITRLYGFADVVELSLAAPQGVAGFSAPKVSIPADKTQATLSLQVAADAKPGTYSLNVSADLKQNTRPVKLSQPLTVIVVAP